MVDYRPIWSIISTLWPACIQISRGELRGRGRGGGWRGGRQEGGYLPHPPGPPPRYHEEDRYYDQRPPPPRYYDRGASLR